MFRSIFSKIFTLTVSTILFVTLILTPGKVYGGIPIPGLQSGPTPFQSIFATGFGGSYNTFGTGTTAGAIGAYGRFVTGGASSGPHGTANGGGGGGYGRK